MKNTSAVQAVPADGNLLARILENQGGKLDSILAKKEELGIQVIFTQIDRTRKGMPVFTDHYYQVDAEKYFYPASTVKFPIAVLALQKLNELHIPGLDMNSTMLTGEDGNGQTAVFNDPTAADGRPTIAQYIRKILLVSDNDAFNRLYEFLGQEYINNTLHKMGYTDAQIIHRLSISLSDKQNRHTNPVRFTDSSGNTLYEKPAERSELLYAQRNSKLGKGYLRGEELVNEPFDFSQKNRLTLQSLHAMLKAVMFPEAVPASQRFLLRDEEYAFLRKYMSMRPGESRSPQYAPGEYWDNYVKMIFYGAAKSAPLPHIRIFNKTGTAYGFLTETAYFADFENKVEFMVSAVIYCNSDGIFNDDHYDYQQVGYPFLQELGQRLYEYEKARKRKHRPDLSAFRFEYNRDQ